MTFKAAEVAPFLADFAEVSPQIRAFPGCEYLELWQDIAKSGVVFTYSYWSSTEALEAYRHSDLFQRVWAKTKLRFADRPEAWSVETRAKLL